MQKCNLCGQELPALLQLQEKSSTTEEMPRPPKKMEKSRRGVLKLALLNIKGGRSGTTRLKWQQINQLMCEEKIDILAVQKAHLDKSTRDEINILFERQITIFLSLDLKRPNTKGVGFILHKNGWRQPQLL